MNTSKNKSSRIMLPLCFVVFALFSNFLTAQNFEKTHFIIENGFSEGTYIQETNDGEYLLAGNVIHWDGLGDTLAFVRKIDANGDELWTQTLPVGFENQRPSVRADSQGNIYLLNNRFVTGTFNSNMVLTKYDAAGQELWQQEYGNGSYDNARDLVLMDNDDVLIVGSSRTNFNESQIQAIRVGSDGSLIWSQTYGSDKELYGSSVIKTSDGNYVIGGRAKTDSKVYLQKIDGDGTVLWLTQYAILGADDRFQVVEDNVGNLVVAGRVAGGTDVSKGYVLKTDSDGQELWKNILDAVPSYFYSLRITDNNQIQAVGFQSTLAVTITFSETGENLGFVSEVNAFELNYTVTTSDGGSVTIGEIADSVTDFVQIFVRKTTPGDNALSGNIFADDDANCELNSGEIGINNWYIRAKKGDQIWYGLTDAVGNYQILELPAGEYEVSAFPPASFWDFCEDSYSISFVGMGELQVLNIPVIGFVYCPHLEVQIATDWSLRICEESRYFVHYCNTGNEIAEDAYVEVTIDQYQTFINASILPISQVGNTFTFDLGDVEPGNCDNFYFDVELACDTSLLGYTHCVEAHIFPDSICVDTADWSGASLELTGTCEDGMINFTAKNIGDATSTPTLNFIVIEDQVIYMEGGIDNLSPNAEEVLTSIPANGKTYRIQLEQEAGHPGNSMPTVAVEGCTANGNQSVSLGFVNNFATDDANNFIDISCLENAYPCDPNDKLAVPYGYGEEHFIRANQQIEYTIRFQNTGTAPAFTVVIRDTLPETLNPATLRHGAASHPYTFAMEGNGVAIFTFENINLPDSTSNFDASQGFVKFDIQQQADLPNGTLIENDAAIFFDLASPVITPVAFHTVGEDFVIISDVNFEFETLTINAFPNPFTDFTTIALDGMDLQNVELQLFDAVGKLVKTAQFLDNQVAIQRDELTSGIYFFTIQSEGRFVGNGKLVVQ